MWEGKNSCEMLYRIRDGFVVIGEGKSGQPSSTPSNDD